MGGEAGVAIMVVEEGVATSVAEAEAAVILVAEVEGVLAEAVAVVAGKLISIT